MNRWISLASASFAAAALSACAAGPRPHAVAPASHDDLALLFDQVKALEGTWEITDEHGHAAVASVFTVTSNGSVVREIMFPGTPHEMTNVYHMDGRTLVMTHYCAAGNQPRLRAAPDKPGAVALKFDSVTNLTAPDQMYMGQLTLYIKDPHTVVATWKSFRNGVEQPDHCPTFTLTRKH